MRILVVDDHLMTCVGLASYIEESATQTVPVPVVVKSVYSLKEAIAELGGAEEYQFVFLDLTLDRQTQPLSTLKAVQEHNKHNAKVIVFTGLPLGEPATGQIFRQCMNSLGAYSILPKSANHDVMFTGLARLLAGEEWMSSEVLRILLSTPNPKPDSLNLTARQWDVARGIDRGLRNKEIANELKLSEGNVRQLVSAIFRRLGVNSRIAVSNRIRAASDPLSAQT